MKRPLLWRGILTYILFCAVGFVVTTLLVYKNHTAFQQIMQSQTILKHSPAVGYYLVWIVACAAALVILLVYIFMLYRSLNRIVKEASSFAEGEHQSPLSVESRSELALLSDMMSYMSGELNSLEENQRKFISNISHDFRSPLTSIKGYAEAIADGTIPPENQEKYLNVIISETERLETLTESILELNKYSDRGTYLNFSNFDLNEMIRQTLLTFEGLATEKNLNFDLHLADQALYVHADAGKIDQVLHNLIDNAIKFSPEGADVTIETSVRNGKAFTSIKDYGVGISKENQSKIWERFYKTDSSRGRDKKGTGLGLAIVKEIISAHHENINVISTEGVGTEFVFSLTLAE